jgi:hypothetical protein
LFSVGGVYVISYGSNVYKNRLPKKNMTINGSSISASSRLKSFSDYPAIDQFKRFHLNKSFIKENIVPSTAK